MKILLINPPFYRLKGMRDIYLPLGIASLAAYVRKPGRDVRLYNAENPTGVEQNRPVRISSLELLESAEMFEKSLRSDRFVVWNEMREVISYYKPDIVGVSVMSCKYRSALKLTEIIKKISKDIICVWGGPHCSADGVGALRDIYCVDYVIVHEGEKAFELLIRSIENGKEKLEIPNLIYRKNGQIIENPQGELIADLDELPFPLRDIDVFQERYPKGSLKYIMASRGCPYHCSFCNSAQVWGRKIRRRSVDSILAEIKEMKSKYGIKQIRFSDDTFTIGKKNTIAFCEGLIRSGLGIGWSCTTRFDMLSDELCKAMRDSGITTVSCGIESGSDRILRAIKKGLDREAIAKGVRLLEKYGIDWTGYFMVGFPMETVEDINLTREFWRQIRPSSIVLSIYTPYPGSELYEVTKKSGLLPDRPDWSSFSHQNLKNYFVKNIPRAEFKSIVKDMFKEVETYNSSLYNLIRRAYSRRRYFYKHLGEFVSLAFKEILYRISMI